MIVGECFWGDVNRTLMDVQHTRYGWSLWQLFDCARNRYLAAVRLTQVRTELWERARDVRSFDHRTLQVVHDRIAAYFRFKYDPRGQMPLPYDGRTYGEWLELTWCQFLDAEAQRLVEEHNHICRGILTVVAYENTELGYAAEESLVGALDEIYDYFLARNPL